MKTFNLLGLVSLLFLGVFSIVPGTTASAKTKGLFHCSERRDGDSFTQEKISVSYDDETGRIQGKLTTIATHSSQPYIQPGVEFPVYARRHGDQLVFSGYVLNNLTMSRGTNEDHPFVVTNLPDRFSCYAFGIPSRDELPGLEELSEAAADSTPSHWSSPSEPDCVRPRRP